MEKQEQLIRYVKSFGNGAHIFAPRNWLGEKVILIRPPKKSLKERVMQAVEGYLDRISGVYIYGSYARGEQKEDSDIDLLVLTNGKIKIKEEGFEITCIEESKFDKFIKLEPLLIQAMLSEAKPIINYALLENLKKKYSPKKVDFEDFINSTKRLIDVNEYFLGQQNEYVSGGAEVYSIVFRLRGIFSIKRILRREVYSHKEFKAWILRNLPSIDFNLIYEAYKKSKSGMNLPKKIKKQDLSILLEFLNKELTLLENEKKKKGLKRELNRLKSKR